MSWNAETALPIALLNNQVLVNNVSFQLLKDAPDFDVIGAFTSILEVMALLSAMNQVVGKI